ncbi:hypothetical protein Ancab_030196 [Ancistrocladus abbreviatus]
MAKPRGNPSVQAIKDGSLVNGSVKKATYRPSYADVVRRKDSNVGGMDPICRLHRVGSHRQSPEFSSLKVKASSFDQSWLEDCFVGECYEESKGEETLATFYSTTSVGCVEIRDISAFVFPWSCNREKTEREQNTLRNLTPTAAGKNARFWEDVWRDNISVKSKFPRLFSLVAIRDVNISDMVQWRDDQWEWEFTWHRELRYREVSLV